MIKLILILNYTIIIYNKLLWKSERYFCKQQKLHVF
jgi:hypothetical protein